MTDYFKGLLQRSMGLTAVIQPLIRPQSAANVARAGSSIPDARWPDVPAESSQLEAPLADAFRSEISAERLSAATAPVSRNGLPLPAGGDIPGASSPPRENIASGTNHPMDEPPMQENKPGLAATVLNAQAIHGNKAPHHHETTRLLLAAQDGRTVGLGRYAAHRPASEQAEPGRVTQPVAIPVSRLVSPNPARQNGPLDSGRPLQTGDLPAIAHSIKASPMADGAEGLESFPAQYRNESAARGDELGQEGRDSNNTNLSFNRRAATGLSYHNRPEPYNAAGESAVASTIAGAPIPSGSRPEYPTHQQGIRVPSPRARERLVSSEPPLPNIEVTIGRVEVRAILPPSPSPPMPARRKRPIMPLDEYLKARDEDRR